MDSMSLLSNAVLQDQDGEILGVVMGFKVMGGKMIIYTYIADEDDEPEPGAKEPIPVVGNVVEFRPDPILVEQAGGN